MAIFYDYVTCPQCGRKRQVCDLNAADHGITCKRQNLFDTKEWPALLAKYPGLHIVGVPPRRGGRGREAAQSTAPTT